MKVKVTDDTHKLAAEMAARMGISEQALYADAIKVYVHSFYSLDDIINPDAEMSARDYLYILRQLPPVPGPGNRTVTRIELPPAARSGHYADVFTAMMA